MKKTFAIFLFFCGCQTVASAQIANTYDVDRGLAQGFVPSVIQDDEGYLWVGTNNGLSRFDGTRFKNFRAKAGRANTLQSNKIHRLLKDSQGRLWIVNGETIQWYDANTSAFHTPAYFKANRVSNFKNAVFDSENRLWVLTHSHIFCLSWEPTQSPDQLREVRSLTLPLDILDKPRAFLVDTNGLVLGSNRGLWQCDFSGANLRAFPGSASWDVTQLLSNKWSTGFWVQTYTGTGLWHDGRWSWFEAIKGSFFLKYDHIYAQNKTYLLSNNAIFEWNRAQLSTKAAKLPFEIISGCADAQGNLWLGSNAKGLFQFNLRQHAIQSFWVGKMVSKPIFKKKDGTILSFIDAQWQTATGGGETINASVLNMCLDNKGELWHWRSNQTLQKADGTIAWKCPTLKPNNRLLHMVCLPNGCFVLAQGNNIIFTNAATGKMLRLNSEMAPKQRSKEVFHLNSIKSDGQYVWLGTDGGLVRVSLNWEASSPDCVFYTQNAALSDREVLALTPDSARGAVWVGTPQGFYKFSPETRQVDQILTHVIKSDETVYCMQRDQQGRLWLGTNAGLKMYDPEQGKSAWFSMTDGLPASEFNRNTEFLGADGEILMGTVSGGIRFYPEQLLAGVSTVKTVISEFLLNDTLPTPSGATAHCFQSDRITILFSSLDFAPTTSYQYRYRLLGLSDEWTIGSSNASVTFAHLPAGRYTFEVCSSTGKADWGEPAQVVIAVAYTPMEKIQWFALACLAILALGAGFWWYYRAKPSQSASLVQASETTAPPVETTPSEHPEGTETFAFRDIVLQLIAENFHDSDFNTQTIQEKINISKAQLHRRMVAESGNTAAYFLKKRRLEEALIMLRDRPDMTISEVAYACGFSDPNYFSTAFSANFGESPKKFREHLRQ